MVKSNAYNDTVSANLNVIPNRCGFYDGVLAYVDVITNFHGVVVEVSSIGFVWRPAQKRKFEDRLSYDVLKSNSPHHATLSD